MRTSVRTGVALTASSLAMSGFALLTPQAGASTAAPERTTTTSTQQITSVPQQVAICRYRVKARHGLRVHRRPFGRVIGFLPHGKRFWGTCHTVRGWVQIRAGVPRHLRHGWVVRHFLQRIR